MTARIRSGQATRQRAGTKRALRLILIASVATLMPLIAAAQSYETIYSFQGSPDGADPKGGLVIGANGTLYGTTNAGGTSAFGTVFELTKPTGEPWKETVLQNFSGSDGQYPQSALVFGSTGALYGATAGGQAGPGTIFELAPPAAAGDAWTETVLYSFGRSRGSQNVLPNGPVLIGPSGTLYTTTHGQPSATGFILGLVIALVPPLAPGGDWTEYELYAFGTPGEDSGLEPLAGVVSVGGSLFGTTFYGGAETVYELTPPATHSGAWTETTIHAFGDTPGDGAYPLAALTVGPGGVLYGTTSYGGSGMCPYLGGEDGCGTVFTLTPPSSPGGAWTETVIYSFTGSDNGDGGYPAASVVVGSNGVLYGTTEFGGNATTACPGSFDFIAGCGTVFELTPPSSKGGAWTEKVLHSFSDADGDGSMPVAGLALSSTGVLYGTTSAGGTAGKGTVFAVAP